MSEGGTVRTHSMWPHVTDDTLRNMIDHPRYGWADWVIEQVAYELLAHRQTQSGRAT